ncbi:helix-hairpin-helix domain-containing protein [Methylocystis sp. MJC1]|jgi:predicted RecB family nuclease|uniref:helix-hairpin-helix domain-containing protein n=1 Tax=Methylocystis sp. MJC1 TaxID=2654282 RepID=UPI0013EC412A|nr:helix-hairpin-helix domain-containing protein [Methylocystis sp. MJC1]KAF2989802.1 hypothetical protein MJC1_03147 [Methylocystis sp. MJC1]MBU6526311.1 helix-hairpin-helix domain-containing protein [Methylocystis sp. MJC1]UZX12764.1 helix-hairpin-helix domain-containing protein [Methylocystis sp. MJC1]
MIEKFPAAERDVLLGVKGVGPKVVERFEQLGIHTLQKLAKQDALAICEKNSPQARDAVTAAISAAQSASRKVNGES